MDNLKLYNAVRNVPKEAQKPITAGRLKGKTDINPMWRIKTLTEQFGVCGIGWYTNIVKQWLEEGADGEIGAFVEIELFIFDETTKEWSKPITGVGGSMFVSKEKNGYYTDDDCYKKAYTDAISIACKALGIGADVYFEKDSTKYDEKEPTPTATHCCIICGCQIDDETYRYSMNKYGYAYCGGRCKNEHEYLLKQGEND